MGLEALVLPTFCVATYLWGNYIGKKQGWVEGFNDCEKLVFSQKNYLNESDEFLKDLPRKDE